MVYYIEKQAEKCYNINRKLTVLFLYKEKCIFIQGNGKICVNV